MILTRRNKAFAAIKVGMTGRVVVNAAKADDKPTEILLIGPVGTSYWSDEGIREKDVHEALSAVPAGRKIVVGINSPGGACDEGLAIYNAFRRRSSDITARIDGYACSIASVFPLGAGRVISPKSCVWMVHEPWMMTVGNARDHQKTISSLKVHSEVLAGIYADRTGRPREEWAEAMDEETWMTGEEAHARGLAHETNDDEVTLDAIEDSPFARVPKVLVTFFGRPVSQITPLSTFRRVSPPAPADRQQSDATSQQPATTESPMNRIAILALLKKHGVTVTDNATDADLQAEGLKLINAGKVTLAEYSAAAAPAAAPPTPQPQAPAAPAADVGLANRLAAIEAQNLSLRTADVTRRVDAAIAERRIPRAARDNWVRRGLAEASSLDELAAYPQQLPGEEPLIELVASAPEDVFSGLRQMRRPFDSFRRGEDVDRNAIRDAATAIGRAVALNRTKLSGPLAATTHTIDSDLKRIVILSDLMRAFKRRILPLNAFSTVFSGIPFRTEGGTDEFVVPFYDLDTAASTNWDAGTGYTYAGNTSAGKRKVTVNARKYQSMDFSSELLARQPYFNPSFTLMLKAEQLANDVFTTVAGVITAANYSLAGNATLADAFDYEDVVDLRVKANQNHWPVGGRSLFLESEYDGALTKDDRVARVDASGSDAALRRGVVGMVAGFETFENPSIPLNGAEKLKGFASFTSAVLVGVSPIEPAPGVRALLRAYEVVTDPDTGISFSYRYGGNTQMDRDESVIECAFGYAKGNEKALIRVVTP